jgi:predicted dehydrogenase
VMFASQISSGEENDLRIRVYGEKGSLTWHQENPNYLRYKQLGNPEQVLKRGNGYLCEAAQRASRIPAGHPEAFIEAFANVYRNVAHSIVALREGRTPDEFESDFPTVRDGARGVRFIEKTIESGQSSEKWIRI